MAIFSMPASKAPNTTENSTQVELAEIEDQFDLWNDALLTGDPATEAAMYAPKAVLLPTVSNRVRKTPAGIEDYFVTFMALDPNGTIDESYVRLLGPNVATNSGIYTFNVTDANGTKSQVQARFSYVYEKINGTWYIDDHHSSKMPEPVLDAEDESEPAAGAAARRALFQAAQATQAPVDPAPMPAANATQPAAANATMPAAANATTPAAATAAKPAAANATGDEAAEVTAQFKLWNDALATGDPKKVADMYGPRAVLLPTISNRVRTTPEGIEDYFVKFLELDPVGTIDESHVRLLPDDVAINSGLYTFVGVKDGEPVTVHARFTFVYKKINGVWMIMVHHSSGMPQPELAPELEPEAESEPGMVQEMVPPALPAMKAAQEPAAAGR
ncbi:hypothetical protein FOA52_012777 [Chlamydomonas sp. UWO 241]|nr:hypothetical protein FOA52_012777 [Chlamydomonas sp. UWO 241]